MLYYIALLLPSFVCLFWAVTLLNSIKFNDRPQNIWMITMLFMGISTFIWSIYFGEPRNTNAYYKLDILETFSTLMYHPMLFFCLKSLISNKPFRKIEYLWFLPAICIGGSNILLYIFMGNQQATAYILDIILHHGKATAFTEPVYQAHYLISIRLYNLFIMLQSLCIVAYLFLILYKKRWKPACLFPEIQRSRPFVFCIFISLFLSMVGSKERFYYSEYPKVLSLLLIVWTIITYYIGYNIYNQNRNEGTQKAVPNIEPDNQKPKSTVLAKEKDNLNGYIAVGAKKKQQELLAVFNKTMEEGRMFLQSNLRLDDMSRLLNTNRTYLSRMINEEYHCTFSDFINRKRIEYAQELMHSTTDLTQEQIAEKCGFLHTSTFSRTFKHHAGITFREWQKRNIG